MIHPTWTPTTAVGFPRRGISLHYVHDHELWRLPSCTDKCRSHQVYCETVVHKLHNSFSMASPKYKYDRNKHYDARFINVLHSPTFDPVNLMLTVSGTGGRKTIAHWNDCWWVVVRTARRKNQHFFDGLFSPLVLMVHNITDKWWEAPNQLIKLKKMFVKDLLDRTK